MSWSDQWRALTRLEFFMLRLRLSRPVVLALTVAGLFAWRPARITLACCGIALLLTTSTALGAYEYYECTLADGTQANCIKPCVEGQKQRWVTDYADIPVAVPQSHDAVPSKADVFHRWIDAISSWFPGPDAKARQINKAIETRASPQLKAYPYAFHVLRTEGSTAILSTPRNIDVPAFHMLGVLYPEMDVKNPNNKAFIAAQKTLGEVQSEARAIVLSQPGITCIQWELDRSWLKAHSIDIPAASPR
jgi:hypothetical protein